MIMNTLTSIPFDPVAVDPVNPLGVLLVEDSQVDADRVLHELEQSGIHPVCVQVATAARLEAALGSMLWDVILCASHLEHLSARAALDLVRRNRVDAPFIVLADPDSEPDAAAISPSEADGYIPINRLRRLAPVVERLVERARYHAAEQKECEAAMETSDLNNDGCDSLAFDTIQPMARTEDEPFMWSIQAGSILNFLAHEMAA